MTIGPAFFSAAIYLCLARIITVYGEGFSRFSPRTYTITFMIADFVALIFQAAGGAILGGEDPTKTDAGLAIIKTGLAAHLAAISIFVILASELGFRIHRNRDAWNPNFKELQRSWRFKMFLICKSQPRVPLYSNFLTIPRPCGCCPLHPDQNLIPSCRAQWRLRQQASQR